MALSTRPVRKPVKFCTKPMPPVSLGCAAMAPCRPVIFWSIAGVFAPTRLAACFRLPWRPSSLPIRAPPTPVLSAVVSCSRVPSFWKSSCARRAASGLSATKLARLGFWSSVFTLDCSWADCFAWSRFSSAAGCGMPIALDACSAAAACSGATLWAATRLLVARIFGSLSSASNMDCMPVGFGGGAGGARALPVCWSSWLNMSLKPLIFWPCSGLRRTGAWSGRRPSGDQCHLGARCAGSGPAAPCCRWA